MPFEKAQILRKIATRTGACNHYNYLNNNAVPCKLCPFSGKSINDGYGCSKSYNMPDELVIKRLCNTKSIFIKALSAEEYDTLISMLPKTMLK